MEKKITYKKWKEKLINVTAKETGKPKSEIKINDNEAKNWYNDGWNPEYVFRETYGVEDDCGY